MQGPGGENMNNQNTSTVLPMSYNNDTLAKYAHQCNNDMNNLGVTCFGCL